MQSSEGETPTCHELADRLHTARVHARTLLIAECMHMQRLAWRGDSCLDCKGPEGEDLSGGFYEAGGSYLKFSFPTAYTFTQLAWGIIEFKDGYVKVILIPAAVT